MFKPKYTISHQIVNDLLKSAEVRSVVLHTSILPQQEAKLRRQALVRMIHSSTSIEGNILNRYQVEKILDGKKVDAPERDIHEVKNYQKAIYYVYKFLEKKQKITSNTILELHGLISKNTLAEEKCGKFRKDKVYVVKRRGSKIIKVSYTGPQAKQVTILVKDLVNWIDKSNKDKVCPIITAAIAHAEIAAIHPFADGNGRTARILATLILYQQGYDFRRLFALEDYYNQNRPAYYKAIHLGKNYQERVKGDLTNWLEYFTQGFAHEMEEVREKILPLSLDAKMKEKMGGQVYLDKKQIQIVDFMMAMGKVSSDDVVDVLNVDKRTAQRYINIILKTKLIRKEGKGPASFYVLNI